MILFNNHHRPSWYFAAGMLIVMVMLQIIGQKLFRYQHDWQISSQYWRLLSAHWAHTNWAHFALNASGLVLCLSITGLNWSILRWLVYQLIFALGISLMFVLFNPELNWYLGYSGILYGVFLLSAIDLFPRDKLVAGLLGTAIVIKIFLEQTSDINLNSSDIIGTPVIVDAHLYGVILAIIIALMNRTMTVLKQR